MGKADTTFGKVACRWVGISVSNGWKQKGKKKVFGVELKDRATPGRWMQETDNIYPKSQE